MEQKKRTLFHIGTSFVLVTFILLCLVSFSVLSIVNANSDFQLSESYANYISSYYNADVTSKTLLNQIRETLVSEYKNAKNISPEDYFKSCTEIFSQNLKLRVETEKETPVISFSVDITDTQKLMVSLELEYPEQETGVLYRILSWTSTPSTDWTPTENMPVFDGQFSIEN